VREVLVELGAGDKPVVTALNKIDRLGPAATPDALAEQLALTADYVPISAQTGDGLDDLLGRIDEVLARDQVALSLSIPFGRGDLVQLIRERGQVRRLEYGEGGVEIEGSLPTRYLAPLREAGLLLAGPNGRGSRLNGAPAP
jgi:GTP-binding protein HflX